MNTAAIASQADAIGEAILSAMASDSAFVPDAGLADAHGTPGAPSMDSIAHRFIGGPDLEAAYPLLRHLRQEHSGFVLNFLGEAVALPTTAAEYGRQYAEALEVLPDEAGSWAFDPLLDGSPRGIPSRVNLSLKATSLLPRLDAIDFQAARRALEDRLRPLFRSAMERDVALTLDQEQYRYRDLILEAFVALMQEDEFEGFAGAGIVIQAYLRDSEATLDRLLWLAAQRSTPFLIRLVRGAYSSEEVLLAAQENWPVPVFTHKGDTDSLYEHLSRTLVGGAGTVLPALATHNVRSVAVALAAARAAGLPDSALEFQMLLGSGEPLRRALVAMGLRTRVYVPVGEGARAARYLQRRLTEWSEPDSFLRYQFVERLPHRMLLAEPIATPEAVSAPHDTPAVFPTETESPGKFRNEPHADFARASTREAMEEALQGVRSLMGRHHPVVIDGRPVQTEKTITSVNPAHPAEVVGTTGSAGIQEAELAVRTAVRGLASWRTLPEHERAAVLFRAAARMRAERFRLSAWEVFEAGKPWREADADVAEAIDFLEYYGRETLRLGVPRQLSDIPGESDVLFYQGRGVAAVIAPWNFPLAILAGMTSGALAAGNTVVMKPAQPTPVVAWEFFRLMMEAGLPEGALSYLPGPGGEVGAYLASHPAVDLVAFTGSRDVGLGIMASSSRVQPGQRNVRRVIAEMGGKNAIIVDETADIAAAAEGIVASAFGYGGQKCSACSRLIAVDRMHDALVERLLTLVQLLPVGDPSLPATRVGPLINAEAKAKVEAYVEAGRREATLALAIPAPAEGFYVGPHVFVDVEPGDSIAQEEIFGPVLSVLRARDFDEALSMALGTQYGLTGGLYSKDEEHIARAYREFDVGNLYVNRGITGAMVGRQPFGGSRMSGVGSKAGGPDYLLQFTEPRVVTQNVTAGPAVPPGWR